MKSLQGLELALILLALVSLAVLFLPRGWLNYSLVLDPRDYPARLTTNDGGQSQVSWIDEDQQAWRCKLDEGERYKHFCSLVLTLLDDRWQGKDLRRFQKITIDADYEGDGDRFKIYFRNRHPRYYVSSDEMSTKYNMVDMPIEYLSNKIPFNMSDFSVADWWRERNRVSPENSRPEFNDVIYIEFQTSYRQSQIDKIQIKKISLKGQVVTDEVLYRVLALVWVLVILASLLFRLLQVKREIYLNTQYQNELLSINKLLNLQSKQSEDFAKKDYLTGVLNRFGVRDVLLQGLHDWEEKQTPFSLVMIDLDHFKQINDKYGHDIGDKILIAAAKVFQENIDESCCLARWGGEEFVLACNRTNGERAISIAEDLADKLRSNPVEGDIQITASFGVSTLSEPNLSLLFKNADGALYQAKDCGRDRVMAEDKITKIISGK